MLQLTYVTDDGTKIVKDFPKSEESAANRAARQASELFQTARLAHRVGNFYSTTFEAFRAVFVEGRYSHMEA